MSQGAVLEILQEGVFVALKIAGPLLGVSIAIGLIIAIFQAATQIHEQTLTFVPKIIVIAFLLLSLGTWMGTLLMEYTTKLFNIMTTL